MRVRQTAVQACRTYDGARLDNPGRAPSRTGRNQCDCAGPPGVALGSGPLAASASLYMSGSR